MWNIRQQTVPVLFFLLIFLTGIAIYKDYGISWDEETSRKNGIISYDYIFKNNNELLSYKDRDYGVAFELPLIILEKVFGLKDTQDVFYMRHLFTFLLFFVSLIFYFLLAREYLGNWKIGLLGSLLFFMSPRIFAHSFYNSKDLPFLSFYLISIYSLIKFLDKKTFHHAFLHGFVSAFLIDIRIIGIVVPLFTVFFVLIEFIKSTSMGTATGKKIILSVFIYLSSLVAFTYLFWPYLWSNPTANFMQAFFNMSNFRWNSAILYMGEYINPPELPWHYIPVWIIVTTPLLYVFNFFIGLLPCLKSLVSDNSIFHLNKNQQIDIILLSYFFLPIASVIILRSPLYDGWRHLFFLYPPFLLISLRGLIAVYEYSHQTFNKYSRIFTYGYILFFLVQVIYVAFFMIKYHPHQNMFFNFLAGRNMSSIKKTFEFDYWGLSYKQALKYIIDNDSDENIKIFAPNPMARINANILSREERDRLNFITKIDDAKYFVSNYRWHIEEPISENEFYVKAYNLHRHEWLKIKFHTKDELFSVKIDGARIVTVYKLPMMNKKLIPQFR